MRLYLSSERIGERAGALLALTGFGRRAAVVTIGSALRSYEAGLFGADLGDPGEDLALLGFEVETLDLDAYRGAPERLHAALRGVDLCWVPDGDAFALRRAMAASGFDEIIVELLEADALVYGGAGAGAALAAPSLEGFHHFSDPFLSLHDASRPPPDGLGLIDHAIVPHLGAAGPTSRRAQNMARHLALKGLRFRALRDGEAIVWIEDRRRSEEIA